MYHLLIQALAISHLVVCSQLSPTLDSNYTRTSPAVIRVLNKVVVAKTLLFSIIIFTSEGEMSKPSESSEKEALPVKAESIDIEGKYIY